MALPLSPNIVKAVEKLFSDMHKEEVVRLLTEQCAENLQNCKNEDEYELEDLRFRVLKLSEGNIEKLRDAVRMANEDWRDLMGAAGSVRKYRRELLGNALERNVKSDAVWYCQVWSILGLFATFTSFLILNLSNASVLQFVAIVLSIAVIDAIGMLLISRLFGIMRDLGKYIFLAPLRFWFSYALGYLSASLIRFFY